MENILFFAELYGVRKKRQKKEQWTVMRLVHLEAMPKTVKFYFGRYVGEAFAGHCFGA
jgi:hypothetical protein